MEVGARQAEAAARPARAALNPSAWGVRPAFAALPAAVVAVWLCRSLAHGVGADELSLLAMAQSMREGRLPYDAYWDVRLPLAYVWALPSAWAEDAVRAVAMLRVLAWLAQVAATWTFFCLFRRTLGLGGAALGALALALSANVTALHAMALPNHFSMAASVVAFACLVAGRRGRSGAWIASALLAGALPWIMTHAALAAAALGLLALREGRLVGPRRRGAWLTAAMLPSAAVAGAYWFWGPFETFLRTALAPLGVLNLRAGGSGYRFFSSDEAWRLLSDSPQAALHALALGAGLCLLPAALRAAPPGSALRLSAWLAAPLALGYAAMAYAKPPAPPEYWIDLAPVIGLLIGIAGRSLLGWGGWRTPRRAALRAGIAVGFAATLALRVDPWQRAPRDLPTAYCANAVPYWIERMAPSETVLNLIGLCGFQLLDRGARLHPPFTFGPLWMRQFGQAWVGAALDGDGSSEAAAARLQAALADDSSAGLILADGELLRQVRQRGWSRAFHQTWRLVWFKRVDGIATGERLARMAIFARRRHQ